MADNDPNNTPDKAPSRDETSARDPSGRGANESGADSVEHQSGIDRKKQRSPVWHRTLEVLLRVFQRAETTSARRIFRRGLLIGVSITLLCMIAQALGLFRTLEGAFYDHRARAFQSFAPSPSDALVLVEIDDTTLAALDEYPLGRDKLAEGVRALREAGATTIGFDLLFTETRDGSDALGAELEGANAILSAKLESAHIRRTNIERALLDAYQDELTLDHKSAEAKLRAAGLLSAQQPLDYDTFIKIKRGAIRQRLLTMRKDELDDEAAIGRMLFPEQQANVMTTERKLLKRELQSRLAAAKLFETTRPLKPDEDGLHKTWMYTPPIAPLTKHAAGIAFVNDFNRNEASIRSMPLAVDANGRLMLPLGVAVACRHLGVDPDGVEIDVAGGSATLTRRDGGTISVPLTVAVTDYGKQYQAAMRVPWHGKARTAMDWHVMFDAKGEDPTVGRMSFVDAYQEAIIQEKIADNNQALDKRPIPMMLTLLGGVEAYTQLKPPTQQQRQVAVARIERELADPMWRDITADLTAAELEGLTDLDKRYRVQFRNFKRLVSEQTKLQQQLEVHRSELKSKVDGKAVILGLTATGAIDVRDTPLHASAPGVLVHATLFNAIAGNHFWSVAPPWVNLLCTLLVGLPSTLVIARMRAIGAALACALLAMGWYTVNGLWMFDYGNLIVSMSPPLVALLLVYASGTVYRYSVESAERRRITKRFRSYVDPNLVRYVIDHPERVRLEGEVREMSVVFTDLQGFTTLSQRLQEATVKILSEYLERMVPIIREHNGLVNKFLGDGIMFFHGAPEPCETHAVDAVRNALLMQQAMVDFNESLERRQLPLLKMRVGISTGKMVVGDSGPHDACDYTVLGDNVNLSSRLEGANKATGTYILVTRRTYESSIGHFLYRPIARLQVAGRDTGEEVYEPIATAEAANDEDRKLAALTEAMVTAFWEGRFTDCVAASHVLAQAFDSQQKLVELYQKQCAALAGHATTAGKSSGDFDGVIALTEK